MMLAQSTSNTAGIQCCSMGSWNWIRIGPFLPVGRVRVTPARVCWCEASVCTQRTKDAPNIPMGIPSWVGRRRELRDPPGTARMGWDAWGGDRGILSR